MKTRLWKLMLAALSVCTLTGGCSGDRQQEKGTEAATPVNKKAQEEIARTTPYGRYPETVIYTLGNMTGPNNSNMPEGDTYENNAYTRYLKELLNIQNQDAFQAQEEQYAVNVSMAIASKSIPDVMVVSSSKELQQLVEADLIADLTDSFENCLSERIHDIYDSYGDGIIESVTFDGKIMAIPETNISDGPNLLWLRKDWMERLDLSAPKTIQDAVEIVKAFQENGMGAEAGEPPIGILCDPNLSGECGYSSEYLMDILFASNEAFPKQWILDENGEVSYGSVQPAAKAALEQLHQLYQDGILDESFLMRTTANNIDMIVNGRCGAFFGPWWAPNNPLMEAVEKDPSAVWEPFLLETDADGSTSYYSQNPTYKYVVVRKDYEHPEIACKIVSALFDYIRYEETKNEAFIRYYKDNVDPTARPLSINVDYNNALMICYEELTAALSGEKKPEDLCLLEYSYYEACQAYLDEPNQATPQQWAAYTSRITACALLAQGQQRRVESLYFDETKTMSNEWWKLRQLEKDTYLKIVTGEEPIEAFDTFVEQWYREGGTAITQEVRKSIERTEASLTDRESTLVQAEQPQEQETQAQLKEAEAADQPDKFGACYEVFVYSFCDSDGDGIGDLKGLISKLDYIAELGFDSIWMMPVNPSPSYHKYDVTDYFAIDPQYGSMEDFEELIREANQRGLKIYLDMVINHTSTAHPWFAEAAEYLKGLQPGEEPDLQACPYLEYYQFARGDQVPKSGWNQLEGTEWYYESVFWGGMPDLNLDHPQVQKELEAAAAFWLEKGVMGFRMDAALHYTESNTTKSAEQLKWFYDYVQSVNPQVYVVAEVWDSFQTISKFYEESGVDGLFDFVLGNSDGLFVKTVNRLGNGSTGMKLSKNLQTVDETIRKANPDAVDGVFLSNHDTGRAAGFVSNDPDKLKLAAGLQLLSTGCVFVYYGDEIGMSGSGKDENKRAPMLWSEEPDTLIGPPEMELPKHRFAPVSVQMEDANSIYQYYKNALAIRNRYPELRKGRITAMSEITEQNGNICAIAKTLDDRRIYLLYNISNEDAVVNIPETYEFQCLADYLVTGEETPGLEGRTLTLPPYGCAVLQ